MNEIERPEGVEEQLRASREQLEVILQGVADGITVLDPQGRMLYANDAAARLIGFDSVEELTGAAPGEVLGRFEVLDEDRRPLDTTQLPGRRALLGERVQEVPLCWRTLASGEERWSMVSATPVLDADGGVRFAITIFRDITERRRSEQAMRFIAQASELLSSSLDVDATLTTLTGLLVPALADWCIVDMLEADGTIRQLAVAHRDPERMDLVRELRRRFPPDWSKPHPITRVLATGRAEVAAHVTERSYPLTEPNDPENLRILVALGLRSHIVVPLVSKGRTLGALSLIYGESDRHYGDDDLALVQEIARRAAVAVENAQLHHASEVAAERLEFQRSLLEAQTEASIEGILVTTFDRRIVSINERYQAVWGLPEDVTASGSHEAVLEVAAPKARDPQAHLDRIDYLYEHPEEVALDTVELADGRTFERFSRPIGGPGAFYGRVWFYRDMTAQKRAEAAQRFLSDATNALNASLDYERTLAQVARLAVPGLTEACMIYLREGNGEIHRVGMAHAGAEAVLERLEGLRIDPDAEGGVSAVLRDGQPQLIPDADPTTFSSDVDQPEVLAALLEPFGLRSWICVPISADGDVVGAFALASSSHRFTEADLELAVELARRASLAIQNARLYLAAQETRDRLEFLAEASAVLSSSLDFEHTLAAVARLAVPTLADWCGVDVVSDSGEIQEVAVAHVDPAKVALAHEFRERYPRPDAPGGSAHVVRTGEASLTPLVTDEMLQAAAQDEEHLQMMRALGLASIMILPLNARGKTLGALTLVSSNPARQFDQGDLAFAGDLARRAAMAVDNARLYRERSRIAETLQHSLLPPTLPDIPGFQVAARYYPATEGTEVGGDFYDLFQTAEDRWSIVIGDVCGKGVDAAALTGLTRYTVRATALQRDEPQHVLSALNDTILAEELEGRFCTVIYGSLHTDGGDALLTLTCAGHPLPLVIRASGQIETVGHPGTLLGVLPQVVLRDHTVRLEPGDAVVLFTDGITERRRDAELFGEAGLRAALAQHAGEPADRLAERIERAVLDFGEGGPRDDMALLVLKRLSRREGREAARAR
jgi:PAS domain S-box-containing protein